MNYKETHIGESNILEQPKKALRLTINNGAVQTKHIADGAVTPQKVSEGFGDIISQPAVDIIDRKYEAITKELYSMVRSLQVGGIALSGKFGDRTDIGIHQKALTKAIGKLWDEIGKITGKDYMNFELTVVPQSTYSEAPVDILITADSTDCISGFDSIRIYVNDTLVAEGEDIEKKVVSVPISETSVVKAVGVILGKTVTKEVTAVKEVPFFMGSGNVYTDIFNAECHKELIGTLEGDYDVVVKNNGEHILITIPKSKQGEFRRADMNGLGLKVEIPMTAQVYDDFVFYKSVNTYKAGTYNIDIDINS